jgi:hypothetical protein
MVNMISVVWGQTEGSGDIRFVVGAVTDRGLRGMVEGRVCVAESGVAVEERAWSWLRRECNVSTASGYVWSGPVDGRSRENVEENARADRESRERVHCVIVLEGRA